MRVELTNADRWNIRNPIALRAMKVLARRTRNEATANMIKLAAKLTHFGSQLSILRLEFTDSIGVAHNRWDSI